MVNFRLLISLLLILSSCNCDDEELTLTRMDYVGNELRVDGYYYYEFESDVPRVAIYFLYKNGIVIDGGSPAVSQISEREQQYESGEYYDLIKSSKDNWGVFKVVGNEIDIERWYPGDPPLKVFLNTGEIINDTSFRITSFSNPDGSDPEARDELYRFKAFSPKPDSTNVFIE